MPLNIKNVDDNRIKQIRIELSNARKSYQLAESQRDKLIHEMRQEGYSIEYLATQFGLTQFKVEYIISKELKSRLQSS